MSSDLSFDGARLAGSNMPAHFSATCYFEESHTATSRDMLLDHEQAKPSQSLIEELGATGRYTHLPPLQLVYLSML
jgi:hypothetical protein